MERHNLRKGSNRAGAVLLSSLVVVLCGLVVVTVHFLSGRQSAPRMRSQDVSAAEPEPPTPVAPSVTTLRASTDRSDAKDRSGAAKAEQLLEPIRRLAYSRSRIGLEVMAVQMDEDLRGMIETARILDPTILPAIRDSFEKGICDGTADTDVDLMLFYRSVMRETRLGTQRGIDCAIRRHRQEDVVLWTALEAWNALGRPDLSDKTFLEQNATDPRTLMRLMPPEERHRRADEIRNQLRR
jgi:hypothetical protein